MRIQRSIAHVSLTFTFLAAVSLRGQAAEYAYSTYALGESAFSAGVTPPPGTYVTTEIGFINAKLAGNTSFGGVTVNVGATADFFSTALNLVRARSEGVGRQSWAVRNCSCRLGGLRRQH